MYKDTLDQLGEGIQAVFNHTEPPRARGGQLGVDEAKSQGADQMRQVGTGRNQGEPFLNLSVIMGKVHTTVERAFGIEVEILADN